METKQTMDNIARIGLGCMGLSHAYNNPTPKEDAKKFLLDAVELGVDFFDTAIVYGFGENELLLGETLNPFREKLFIASKCGLTKIDENGNVARGIDNDPDNIRRSCEQSLRRLQTDYIDLYYLHRWDKKTPIEDCVGVLADLAKEGKIRYIGLSEVSPQTLRKANSVYPITAIQSEYSLWTRDPEKGMLDTCKELGVKFVAFSPLGRGFFTGSAPEPEKLAQGDLRRGMPRFMEGQYDKNKQLLPSFYEIAKEAGCTPSQLTIAWLLNQPYDIYAIPGTTKLAHLKDNWGAKDIKLSSEIIEKLNNLINESTVTGARYNEKTLAELDR